ncbi:mechanosensitive ion channel family protein [Salinigranum marinum]|uniref:mechanosensitive ion channel family protein n=1 Tax=Salinigranum marinum TaxID=1515595 RepID=UPI002989A193|nr:mechanosensitive ion channel family protein [Salinigranum marinum]
MLQLGGLDALVPSLTGKALVTLVTLAVVLATWRAVERLHDHDTDTVPRTLRHFGLSAASVLVTAAGGLVVIAVWGLTGPLVDVIESYSLGPETVVNGVLAMIILATAYGTTDLVGRVTRELTDSRHAISEHQREILYRLSQVSIYVVALSIILGLWGVNLGGLLVGAGFLGIVVGLAARQTLGALLAGFVLMFSRPFEIGDWVEIGDHEGIVTEITIVTTRMQTFDGEYVMVPNDVVSAESVVNRSRKGRLRIEVDVGIDYDADPRHAAELARDAVRGLDAVLRVPTPQVVVKEFADSAIMLGVRVWIDNPSARRKWRTRTAVVGAVKEAFEREGVKIPFPQREVMGREETGGLLLSEGQRLTGDPESATAEPDGGRSRPDEDGGGDGS